MRQTAPVPDELLRPLLGAIISAPICLAYSYFQSRRQRSPRPVFIRALLARFAGAEGWFVGLAGAIRGISESSVPLLIGAIGLMVSGWFVSQRLALAIERPRSA